MSRTGKLPVPVPENVNASVQGTTVTVEGPKGKLEKTFDSVVDIHLEDNTFNVSTRNRDRHARAMFGTTRSIINGMVQGVVSGYSKKLKVCGVGYRANVKDSAIEMSLGYSHQVKLEFPTSITVEVDKDNVVTVSGADKQLVGQVAARIRSAHPLEPYGANTQKARGVYIIGEPYIAKEGKKS